MGLLLKVRNILHPPHLKKEAFEYEVSEGIAGRWHYHLSFKDKHWDGLCGARTMSTTVPLSTWGLSVTHFTETFCKSCQQKYLEAGNVFPKGDQ